MDKKAFGLLSAVAGLAAVGSAHAATSSPVEANGALQASSYADLLAPVPNAMEAMKADNAARTQQGDVELAQYYYGPPPPPGAYYYHHHHHHHHHNYHHHHHHHHHHDGAFIGVPGVGGVVVR
jgi:hypothetical protein